MASGDSTHNPPMVVEISTGTRRPANNDECEVLMGAEVGASIMMGQMQLKYAEMPATGHCNGADWSVH